MKSIDVAHVLVIPSSHSVGEHHDDVQHHGPPSPTLELCVLFLFLYFGHYNFLFTAFWAYWRKTNGKKMQMNGLFLFTRENVKPCAPEISI